MFKSANAAWKFLTTPVAGKGLDKVVKAFGGSATKNSLATEARLQHMRAAAKEVLKNRLKSGEITADIYRHQLRQSAIKHGVPKGNFLQRQIAYVANDISHPIANSKMSLMRHVTNYDPITDKMVGKSPLGIAGASALGIGFPAWMIRGTLKDKNLSNTSKAGRSVAYATLPLATTKLVPSILGYSAVDKVFKPRISPLRGLHEAT